MKRFLLISSLLLLVSACSNGDQAEEQETRETENENIVINDYNSVAAEESYQQSCIHCHGDQLQGLSGPALVDNGLSPESIKDILENGRGTMPAQTALSEDEMDNLSNWLADQ
ncbi:MULTISPECIES: c-type cytochrome [Bacillaceae]|uniref:Cytochrome C551 n=1 Tax=Alkalicoccobacillus plakortidis TaxID=444060 RepID=A0A9D5DXD9_9BACI|nr:MULTISPECIES: cytochrome c [Bacillaceae]KQL58953.1 cytochrome C551 [Alkalicoccobacillus plakortidis]